MQTPTLLRQTGGLILASFVLTLSPALSAQTAATTPTAVTYATTGFEKSQTGDYEGAIVDFTKALELNPNGTGAFVGRGMAQSNLGHFDNAIADFSAALKLRPALAEAFYGRGTAEFLQGNFDAAIADLSKAVELKPDYRTANFQRGLARGAQTNFQGAFDDMGQVFNPRVTSNSLNDYAVLYGNLYAMRMGNPPDVRALATAGWSSPWTRMLAGYITHHVSPYDLMTSANNLGGEKGFQLSEGLYFAGVLKLIANNRAGAKEDFQNAFDTSRVTAAVHRLARAELDHL